MSATRVESPRLLEPLRRMQPSPPFSTLAGATAAAAPKPRACRKLFAVDHAETDRFLSEQLASLDRQQRRETGFDADRCRPLSPAAGPGPGRDTGGGSRYTEWEAVPALDVPAFYRETDSRRKPSSAPQTRPHPPPPPPASLRRLPVTVTSGIGGGDPNSEADRRLRVGSDDCPVLSRRAGDFRPVVSNLSRSKTLSSSSSSLSSLSSTSSSPTSPSRPSSLTTSTINAHLHHQGSSSSGAGPLSAVQSKETIPVELPARRQKTKEAGSTSTTQRTITDFFAQRKRSATSTSPTAAAKRHRTPGTGEGASPVEGQS